MPIKRQTIRDHSAEANLFARRAVIAALVVFALLALVVSNLYVLQVEHYEDYQTRSNGNRIKVLPVAPNRGLIYDRNGVLLAENRPVYSLEIIPEQVSNLDETLQVLQALMGITDEEIADFKKSLRGQRRFKPVALRTRLSEEEVARFASRSHRFTGVSVEARLTRYYPFKDTLTHVVGYVSKINKKDLQKIQEAGEEDNYAATYDIGKLGIEKYHEDILHGKVGFQQVEVNSQGRIIRTLDVQPPTPGRDIVLNLDIRLQQAAQQALKDMRGTIVISSTKTGGILAMYSNPGYDPNLFVHGISSKNYSALLNSPDRPLINRATQGQYPPASTVKPLLGLLGLESKKIDEEYSINDTGRFRLPNVTHVWRDWKKWGHGKGVNITKAIELSCDTYYYGLAYEMGIDAISDYMSDFGFGDYTGIDLYEESDANLPNRGWKKARFNQPWYIGDTIAVGIGQGYWTSTPVQLIHATNALVNNGTRFVPQILRGYHELGGDTTLEPLKTLRPIEIVDQNNWNIIHDAMFKTVNSDIGTARFAFANTPYQSAGKTGTAQLFSVAQDAEYVAEEVDERLRDNAMYVGYAPYDNPEITVVVVVENVGGGSKYAAPMARKMMDAYFELYRPEMFASTNDTQGAAE
ncbi:MAG: penicillin-binding protein 2 [Alteromonadaceae bacterium]|nr:penicillin-binding protein 2 [Alteromonadaceae bacterium]